MSSPVTIKSFVGHAVNALTLRPGLILTLALIMGLVDHLLILSFDEIQSFLEPQSIQQANSAAPTLDTGFLFRNWRSVTFAIAIKSLTTAFCTVIWVRATWEGLSDRFAGGLQSFLPAVLRSSGYFLFALGIIAGLLAVSVITIFMLLWMAATADQANVPAPVAFGGIFLVISGLIFYKITLLVAAIFGATEAALDTGSSFRKA